MSIQTDISPEAVERLAKDHDTVGNDPVRYVMIHPHHWKTAKVLRKLSARVEELEAQLRKCAGALGDISNGEPEWPDDPQKELDWCRNRATTTLAEMKGAKR